MKVKTCPVQIKAAGEQDGTEDGVFEAIVATYDRDSVGDRILPGAFKDTLTEWKSSGNPIPVLWSHMSMDPEYHIGVVEDAEERDEGLWVKARLDLDDESVKARRVYKLLKGRRVTQFSFAYDEVDAGPSEKDDDEWELRKLKVYEVGPTLIGANQQTELLEVKSAGRDLRVAIECTDPTATEAARAALRKAFNTDEPEVKGAVGSHSTATDDAAWDGPANEARLSTDAGAATYRKCYAWVDPDGDAESKSSYKFPHHFVSEDGTVGAASTKACSAAIAALNGGRGGASIPSSDRSGVYAHLRKHLSDAGVEDIPELSSDESDDEKSEGKASEDDLRAAVNKLSSVVAELRRLVEPSNDEEDGDQSSDDDKATPAPAAASPDGAKDSELAPTGTASIRQRIELMELDTLTR